MVVTVRKNFDPDNDGLVDDVSLQTPPGGGGGGAANSVYDSFTDTNGTLITAHAPEQDTAGNGYQDIAILGTAITAGSTTIQSNAIAIANDQNGFGIDLETVDSVGSFKYTPVAGQNNRYAAVLRYVDNNNHLLVDVRQADNIIQIREVVSGSVTQTVSRAVTLVDSNTYIVSWLASAGTIIVHVSEEAAPTTFVFEPIQAHLNPLTVNGTVFGAARDTANTSGVITEFTVASIAGGGGAGAVPVQDEGILVVAAPSALNFTGAGVTATDVAGVATIDIPGGGGGGGTPTEILNVQKSAVQNINDGTFTDTLYDNVINSTADVTYVAGTGITTFNADFNCDVYFSSRVDISPETNGRIIVRIQLDSLTDPPSSGGGFVDIQTPYSLPYNQFTAPIQNEPYPGLDVKTGYMLKIQTFFQTGVTGLRPLDQGTLRIIKNP